MSPARVLVVGFDAADPDILRAMATRGQLPTLGALLEQGAQATVENPVGVYVGALWTSFTTALTPGRHGRHAPRQLVPGTYEARPVTPADVRGRPFWAALVEAGRKVAVVDVPHGGPVDGHGDVQVVEWGAHDAALGLTTWPPSLAEEITSRFGPHPVHGPGRDCDRVRTVEGFVELRDDLMAGVNTKRALSRHLLDQHDWDLFVTVFSEGQCAVHQCWHLRDASHPDHDPATAERCGDVMEQVYAAEDAALHDLISAAGQETTVVVLASHGAKPHYDGSFLLDQVLRRIEMAEMGPEQRVGRLVDERLWASQSADEQWRHPRARDRVWRGFEELMPLDPASRPCFKVDNNEPYGGIRVNLEGREPEGKVAPEELDAFCRGLSADLLEIVNEETGRAAVRRVLRTADLFEGDQVDRLPDLLVEWDWSAPVRSISSPKIGRVEGAYTWSRTGDHRPDGMLVVRGPGVRPGVQPAIQVTDIGPTIATVLSCRLDGVDGRPIDALLPTGAGGTSGAMTTPASFVSVAVPTRNRAASLEVIVESLLRQDYPSDRFEVIVVDDGSTDGTDHALGRFVDRPGSPAVRYIRQRHLGINAARNAALQLAGGDPICFVDDDEELPPSWLRAVADGARLHPKAGALGGPMRLRLEGSPPRMCGREPLGESELDFGDEAREVEWLWGGNLAVRRWAIDRVGLFREDLRRLGGTEVEWEARLRAAGLPIVYLPDAWVWHRRSQAQLRLSRLMLNRFFRGRGQALNGHRLGRPLGARVQARCLREQVEHSVRHRCSVGLITAAQHGGRLVGILETALRRQATSGG